MKFAALSFLLSIPCLCAVAAAPNPFPDLPPTEPEDAFATFDLHPDFKLELVAAEPLTADPVAMSFDENGALYVVEMRGYSERRDEHLGRVKRLEDRNHDGRMDHATVFAEGLAWPTGVLCYDGGVFVLAAPDLWFFKDHDGDGSAEEQRVVLTGFGVEKEKLNVQQLPNNIRWGIDQKIHIAEGGNGSRIRKPDDTSDKFLQLRGRDLVIDPLSLKFHAENGGGQFGMSFDDVGRKFVSSNSDHLQAILYDNIFTAPDSGLRLRANNTTTLFAPTARRSISADGGAAPVYRLSPDEAWRVVRTRWRVSGQVGGPIEGGGRPSGYFTGATGLQIYRGDLFPDSFHGNAFIADVGSNLIHRKQLRANHQTFIGERAPGEQNREFLASTDNWFRPVQLENGPDGALYILDFYRELIEHPWSLPPGIKEYLDLNRGNDRGRIWRVVPRNIEPRRKIDLGSQTTPELVKLLEHPNGWHRDTASRLLTERNDPDSTALLTEALTDSRSEFARLHSLALLNHFDALDAKQLETALADVEPNLREFAIRIAGARLSREELLNDTWLESWLKLARDESPGVRWQLLITLAGHPSQDLFEVMLENSEDLSDPIPALNYFAFGLTPKFHPNNFADNIYRDHPDIMTKLVRRSASQTKTSRIQDWIDTLPIDPSTDALNYKLLAIISGLVRSPQITTNWTLPPTYQNEVMRQAKLALKNDATAHIAFSLLNSSPTEITDALLINMLPFRGRPDLQTRVVLSLVERSTVENFDRLLNKLSSLSPDSQRRFLSAATRSKPQCDWLLLRIELDADLRSSLSPVFKINLRKHPEETVRTWAMEHFEPSSSDKTIEQKMVRYQPAVQIDGDATSGKEIYQSRCAVCHRAGNEGPEIGPDLVTVSRAGRATLLANILDPNREINSAYESWEVHLSDGSELTGKRGVQSGNSFPLHLADGSVRQINQANTSSIRPTGQSMMPEGLEEGLTPERMADLLRFIEELAIPNIQSFAE